MKAAGLDSVKVVDVAWDEGLLLKTIQKDPTRVPPRKRSKTFT
jgi:hypothetical protein